MDELLLRPSFVTPQHIKDKAVEVLRPLNGLSYAQALYALDVAKKTLDEAVLRLHATQAFSPPIFQDGVPKDSAGR